MRSIEIIVVTRIIIVGVTVRMVQHANLTVMKLSDMIADVIDDEGYAEESDGGGYHEMTVVMVMMAVADNTIMTLMVLMVMMLMMMVFTATMTTPIVNMMVMRCR